MNTFNTIKSLLILLIGLSCLNSIANPQPPKNCDCLWQGNFADAAHRADLIVSGTIVKLKGNSADLQINHTLFDRGLNTKEFSDVIRMWGDTGTLCRPSIEDFPVDSEWLLALNKITSDVDGGFNPFTPNLSYGRINDYYLSQCGVYWLPVSEGMVYGNLTDGHRWQWESKKMNPVLLQLIDAYINDIIPKAALIEASKPLTEAKKLMIETQRFLNNQQ